MYGDVSLDFSPNGALTYTVHVEGKRQASRRFEEAE